MKENREENDLLQAALIVLMQFVIVPLTTLKTIFVVKGRTTLGAILGGIGALIYVISLGMVFAELIQLYQYDRICFRKCQAERLSAAGWKKNWRSGVKNCHGQSNGKK